MIDIEKIPPRIRKPSTYLGNEINAFRKNLNNCNVTFALGYPDIYEVGMSNLGIRILYDILNGLPDVGCDRFFAPGADMEEYLRSAGLPLFALESKRPLRCFDFVGFSISSELNYTNFLNLLDLARIPLRSQQRAEKDPFVVAGGNCAFQPEPLADFVDIWVVGEAEESIVELVNVFRSMKGAPRAEMLFYFQQIPGVYVPSLYVAGKDGAVRPANGQIPGRIEKRVMKDFESACFPVRWLVPQCDIVHDRISLEIMRGCPQLCLFCQGGFCWKPVRKRSAEKVLELADKTYRNTGYEEISLLSFSSGDHPEIEKIVDGLCRMFAGKNVAISFPSLRIDSFSFELASRISAVRRTGLTFAPETGETLRARIGKPITDEEVLVLALKARRAQWRQLKLYFILGLPGETHETVLEIAELVESIARIISVRCSFNIFIPKPHTPFELDGFSSKQEYQEKLRFLRDRFARNRFIRAEFRPYEIGLLECLLARGGRELGPVIERVWKQGGRFENWNEFFSFERWDTALETEKIDLKTYLGRFHKRELPWKHISTGFPGEKLLAMRKNFDGVQ